MIRTLFAALILVPTISSAQTTPVCRSTAEGIPSALINRATRAVGMATPGHVLRWSAHASAVQDFQSDRSYPPFFSFFYTQTAFFDPRTGGERSTRTGGGYPGTDVPASKAGVLTGARAAWTVRDSAATPQADFSAGSISRPLNPWAVLADFSRSPGLNVEGRCLYRDYDRVVIGGDGPAGHERLLLDPKTWIPVALLRTETHPIWGQLDVEYVWSNFDDLDGKAPGVFPQTAFRIVEGETQISLTTTEATVVPVDSAPPLTLPDTALSLPAGNALFDQPARPDTIRVAANAWLFSNPMYTSGAVLARDTVFVLDATTSEARARQDSAWIASVFPGRHPVVVVVTDLAWPHVGGVRFWVARGATIVSHAASKPFLDKLIARRWTLTPDALEQNRKTATWRFRPVRDSISLAGGDIVLYPIDGISSEGALMAWVPGSRFLWASDYIQNLTKPTGYAREVLRATRRTGIIPERFAAEHVKLSRWEVVDSLHSAEAPAITQDRPDGALLRVGKIEKKRYETVGDSVMDRGTSVEEVSRTTVGTRPVLLSVAHFAVADGNAVDSSIADAKSLRPIKHVGAHPSHYMELLWNDRSVAGRYDTKAAHRTIDMPAAARSYDSSLFDLVIAGLPLGPGYHALLPFYIYEQGGVVWWDVRVRGTEDVALRTGNRAPAWVVDVSEEGRPRVTLWISRDGPRDVLRSTFTIAPGHTFTSTQ